MTTVTCPTHMDPQEWKLRCDLAALYRLVAHFRMTDFVYTHISVRLPGPEHHFLINKYGVLFHEMRASDLIRIDQDGNVVDSHAHPSAMVNAAGFCIHSAIHMSNTALSCVIHTHTAAGIAVSAQRQGLLPISQHAMRFYGRLGYHDYEGVALDFSERERLVRDLGPHKAMILHNHGLLVCGESIQEAFQLTYMLERACQIQVQAQSGGVELICPPESIRQLVAAQFDEKVKDAHYQMAWQTALRLVASDQPDYRT